MPAITGAGEGGADEEGAGERGAGERGAAVGRQVERGQPANAARTHQQSRRGCVVGIPGASRASCLGVLASAGQGVRGSHGRAWDARSGRATRTITCCCSRSRQLVALVAHHEASQTKARARPIILRSRDPARASTPAIGMRHGVRVRGG
jgi:hypothetical protein